MVRVFFSTIAWAIFPGACQTKNKFCLEDARRKGRFRETRSHGFPFEMTEKQQAGTVFFNIGRQVKTRCLASASAHVDWVEWHKIKQPFHLILAINFNLRHSCQMARTAGSIGSETAKRVLSEGAGPLCASRLCSSLDAPDCRQMRIAGRCAL